MRKLSEINVKDALNYIIGHVKGFYTKTTKKQRIVFVVVVLVLSCGYLFCKNIWEKYSVSKQAKHIIAEVSKSENSFFQKNGAYRKDLFKDANIRSVLKIVNKRNEDDDFDPFGSTKRRRNTSNRDTMEDPNIAQSGDFNIEVDAENACVILRYKKETSARTIYYASFKDSKTLCQGKKCFKQAKNENEDLCYLDGVCFHAKLTLREKQTCGNGKGEQTRICKPSCDGGICEEWGECFCKKGFEWDGTTCKQIQTEKDCNENQCFNGIYCEDKGPLTKNIEKGTCQRVAACQKDKGWQYTPWECSCQDDNLCPLKEECIIRPDNQKQVVLPNEEGSCKDVYYECKEGEGWIEKAKNCICDKPGFFWDTSKKEAKCSPCTKKPEGAKFTSSGKNKDACAWKCEEGYKERKGVCIKPTGQYLCARMDLQICTDEFSKTRKMQKDAKQTNEKQPCFLEDQDNILFYNKKEKSCVLCQCFDLNSKTNI